MRNLHLQMINCIHSVMTAEIFTKDPTDIRKASLVQRTPKPKEKIKPSDQIQCMLPLWHQAWLGIELKNLKRAGIISPFTSNFASPVIISHKKGTHPHMKPYTEWL